MFIHVLLNLPSDDRQEIILTSRHEWLDMRLLCTCNLLIVATHANRETMVSFVVEISPVIVIKEHI